MRPKFTLQAIFYVLSAANLIKIPIIPLFLKPTLASSFHLNSDSSSGLGSAETLTKMLSALLICPCRLHLSLFLLGSSVGWSIWGEIISTSNFFWYCQCSSCYIRLWFTLSSLTLILMTWRTDTSQLSLLLHVRRSRGMELFAPLAGILCAVWTAPQCSSTVWWIARRL